MKNIYLTLLLAITVTFASAQSLQSGPKVTVSDYQAKQLKKAIKSHANNSTKTVSSRWYDYATTMDDNYGNQGVQNFTYLFPDTLITAMYGTDASTPWLHSMVTIIDPTFSAFSEDNDGEQLITNQDTYTLDSVTIFAGYTRNTNASIVDTLVFEFFTTNDASEVPEYYFTGMSDFNTDTLYFKGVKHNYTVLDIASKVTFKLPLNEVDTATFMGWNIFTVGVPATLTASAGAQIGVSVTFRPGYAYTNADTLNSLNYFTMVSMEEQGDATFPIYTPGDYNSSQIASTSTLDATSGWFGLYIPEWAYTGPYGFENHLIQMLFTADAGFVGVEEVKNNDLTVSQNRPNPFNGTTTIDYNLDKGANVSVTVYNVAGAQVMTLNQGNMTTGAHSINIDASNLQAGVYYYTLTANNNSVTKKMIVY